MKRFQGGFSMVELMVASTLGLLLTGALISVFVGSRNAYQATSGVGSLADGGRFALDTIQESARGAGYLGCNHATVTSSQVILNGIAAPLAYDFRFGVSGFEANNTSPGQAIVLSANPAAGAAVANWTPSPDATFTGPALAKQIQNSDILVFRSTVANAVPSYANADVANGATTFTVSGAGASALQGGQVAVISDCTKSVVFQIGSAVGVNPTVVNVAGGGVPGNATNALPFGFSSGALVSPVSTVVYFIGIGRNQYPALERLELINGTFQYEEIAPNVENMQVLYGVDTTGTLTVGAYMTADQVNNYVGPGAIGFNAVLSVKVAVLVASPLGAIPIPAVAHAPYQLLNTSVTAPNDSRQRNVFEMTLGLRNSVN